MPALAPVFDSSYAWEENESDFPFLFNDFEDDNNDLKNENEAPTEPLLDQQIPAPVQPAMVNPNTYHNGIEEPDFLALGAFSGFTAYNPTHFSTEEQDRIILRRNQTLVSTLACSQSIPYTDSDRHQIKLLHILNRANVPHDLFDDIQKWALDAKLQGYNFNPSRFTRDAEIKYIRRWLNMECVSPDTIMCPLPGPDEIEVPVTRFDFTSQLLSLLSDKRLVADLNNLDVNINDPFGKYVSENGLLSCFNSAQFYENAHRHCIKGPNDFLCCIIFACDEAKLQQGSNTGACPLMFTTSLFNQKMRNTTVVWKPLGYIYSLSNIESAKEYAQQSQELKYSRLHAIYAKVLETYIYAQRSNILDNIELTIGSFTRVVNIKVPCAFVIGDMLGGDKICCSAPTYSNRVSRICRQCNVKGPDVGKPEINCEKIRMDRVKTLVSLNQTKALAKLNQYNVYNAWYDVDFGGCVYGIFSAASPIEPLHSLESGLIDDCIKKLYGEELVESELLAELDGLVKQMCCWERQFYLSSGANKSMPILLWKSGISCITNTPAKEKVGIMLTILILSLTSEGKQFFDNHLQNHTTTQMQGAFETLLCYWSWLKGDVFWKRGNATMKERYKNSIRAMLTNLQNLWTRTKGQGWDLAKFHEQLHIPDDIERNGSPNNTNTQPTEHNHIEFIKKPAKRSQRRQINLDQQIANRYNESYLINMAHESIEITHKRLKGNPRIEDKTVFHSVSCFSGSVTLYKHHDKDDGEKYQYYLEKQFKWENVSSQIFSTLTDNLDNIANLEWDFCQEGIDQVEVRFYSEYKRHDTIFRCNPSFRAEGEWYDWVIVRWESDDPSIEQPNPESVPINHGDHVRGNRYCYTPCKIIGFFYRVESSIPEVDDEFYTVVWPCKYDILESSIVFSVKWKLDFTRGPKGHVPNLHLINCDSIVRHCLIIPENIDGELNMENNTVYEIWPTELWADQF